jgi:hypothetical protein
MHLDPESEHVREVYAHYGLAMYWAQCLEQSIFQHLLFFDHFPKAVAKYTTLETWAKDFDQFEAHELGQTMGRLIGRLREVGQPTDAVEKSLAKVLKGRNWLAHGYFADRAIEFNLPDGRDLMIRELEGLTEQFRSCAKQLDAVSLPAAQKLGFTDEMLAKIQAEISEVYANRKFEA